MIHIVAATFFKARDYALQEKLGHNDYRIIVEASDLPKHPSQNDEVRFIGDCRKHNNIDRIEQLCERRGLRVKAVK